VPYERVADVLQLMKRSADTRLDAALAREVCLRDSGVRVLLAGRVEKLGPSYVLNTDVIEPSRGTSVASLSEPAEGLEQLFPAIRRLSRRVRQTLGEEVSRIRQGDLELERVTTPSLAALKLYSQAMAMVDHGRWGPASGLLRRAVALDPQFASAHIFLAWALRNEGRPPSEHLPHADLAVRFSASASERERLFILGSRHDMAGEGEKAVKYFETLCHLFPDHPWSAHKLMVGYRRLGRWRDAIPYVVRHADQRPFGFRAQVESLLAIRIGLKNPAAAERYLVRALELAPVEREAGGPAATVFIQLFSGFEQWKQGSTGEAEREFNRVTEDILRGPVGEQESSAYHTLGHFALSLGKLRVAEEWYRRVSKTLKPSAHHAGLALVAFARGDQQALKGHLTRIDGREHRSPFAAVLSARLGLAHEKQSRYADLIGAPSGFGDIVRGERALARGRTREALALLEEAVPRSLDAAEGVYAISFLGLESLAGIHQRQGRLLDAVRVLEDASREKGRLHDGAAAFMWMRTQLRLAQLYRKLGRENDARRPEAELLRLLARADSDHPMLIEIGGTVIPARLSKRPRPTMRRTDVARAVDQTGSVG